MGRKKLDNGRRVAVSARISEQHAEAIDAERGTRTRSSWLADLIAGHFSKPPEPPQRMPARTLSAPVTYQDAPSPSGVSVPSATPVARAGPDECPPHPKGRITKGLCGACGTNVT